MGSWVYYVCRPWRRETFSASLTSSLSVQIRKITQKSFRLTFSLFVSLSFSLSLSVPHRHTLSLFFTLSISISITPLFDDELSRCANIVRVAVATTEHTPRPRFVRENINTSRYRTYQAGTKTTRARNCVQFFALVGIQLTFKEQQIQQRRNNFTLEPTYKICIGILIIVIRSIRLLYRSLLVLLLIMKITRVSIIIKYK